MLISLGVRAYMLHTKPLSRNPYVVGNDANALQPLQALVCAQGNVRLVPFKGVVLGRKKSSSAPAGEGLARKQIM